VSLEDELENSRDYVYFVSYQDGPIKIGRAINVKKRLKGLQTSHPEKLHVLGVIRSEIKSDTESALHAKFDHLRLRGEWFRRSDELLSYIMAARDMSLYPDAEALREPEIVDVKETDYGVVQVIDEDDKDYLKYGYYDDDDAELVIKCDFCEELENRSLELSDEDYFCKECIWEDVAIVYVGSFQSGARRISHESLRRVDDVLELNVIKKFECGFLPQLGEAIDEIEGAESGSKKS
jgi:hypothetical protein